jgi:LPS-assembly protein
VAELMPFPDWRLFTDNRISPYNGNVTNSILGVEVGKPAGTRASLDYHHAEAKLDYIEGKAAYAEFRPYLFEVSARYSFDRPGFLETLYSVEYKHQCWSLLFSYRDRIDNQDFSLTLTLSGLGMFKLF